MPSKSSLDLRQQVGQLLIMGFDETSCRRICARCWGHFIQAA